MIKSMTGFASLSREDDAAAIGVTLRAVNHRYLDLQLRLPSALSRIESRLRSAVQQRIGRGRVEVSVSVQVRQAQAPDVQLNDSFVEAFNAALEQARSRGLVSGSLTPGDLIRLPQAIIIRERSEDAGADSAQPSPVETAVVAAVEEAVAALDVMRGREGEALAADLDARRRRLAELLEEVAVSSEAGLAARREQLAEKIREFGAEPAVEPAALAQEIVRFVARSDITEEVVRFRTHLEHWRELAEGPEACGRKLDFLLQELNREINTIGSKAEGAAVSALVVNVKAELERVREQVQNVE